MLRMTDSSVQASKKAQKSSSLGSFFACLNTLKGCSSLDKGSKEFKSRDFFACLNTPNDRTLLLAVYYLLQNNL